MVQQIIDGSEQYKVESMPDSGEGKQDSSDKPKRFKELVDELRKAMEDEGIAKTYNRIATAAKRAGDTSDRSEILFSIKWYHKRTCAKPSQELYAAAESALQRTVDGTWKNGNGHNGNGKKTSAQKKNPAKRDLETEVQDTPDRSVAEETATEESVTASPVKEDDSIRWVSFEKFQAVIEEMHGINQDPNYYTTYSQVVAAMSIEGCKPGEDYYEGLVGGIRWHHQNSQHVRVDIYDAAKSALETLLRTGKQEDKADKPVQTGESKPAEPKKKVSQKKKLPVMGAPGPRTCVCPVPKKYDPNRHYNIGDRIEFGLDGLVGRVIGKNKYNTKVIVEMEGSKKKGEYSYRHKRK
jgi:hypothetical protein